MNKNLIKQELLKYFPNKEEAIQTLTKLGLSQEEAEQRVNCKLNEIVIYEAAHRIIDRLSAFSDKILNEFAKILNVEDNRFSFKTEYLFKSLYFLRKKAYAQYIIEREGELIQEISQSGIGVKSDVPPLTNEMMKDLFHVIIFTNGERDLILKAVEMWKSRFKELIRKRSTSICVPCGFNKPLSEYKTINDCIRGMLLYNELMKQDIFQPGSKGYKIYIKGIDFTYFKMSNDDIKVFLENFHNKYGLKKKKNLLDILDRIVIPTDFDTIPEWIKLDEETILDKVFVSKANEVLSAMDIEVNLSTSQILESLF